MGLLIEFASELITYTWDYFSENYKIVQENEDFGRPEDMGIHGSLSRETSPYSRKQPDACAILRRIPVCRASLGSLTAG